MGFCIFSLKAEVYFAQTQYDLNSSLRLLFQQFIESIVRAAFLEN